MKIASKIRPRAVRTLPVPILTIFRFLYAIHQTDLPALAAVDLYKMFPTTAQNQGHGFHQFAARACSNTGLRAARKNAVRPTKNNPPLTGKPFVSGRKTYMSSILATSCKLS